MLRNIMILMATLLILFPIQAFSQDDVFKDEDKDTRHVSLGVSGGGDVSSLSVAAVVPFETEKYEGWVGGFTQQTSKGTEIQSATRNFHSEAGYKITSKLNANVFADMLSDHIRGISQQFQTGFFFSYDLIDEEDFEVTLGAGNYAQDKKARTDLELTDMDPTSIHTLIYAKIDYEGIFTVLRLAPEIDLSNFNAELRPKVSKQLADGFDLGISGVFGYDSQPLADKYFYWSYALTATKVF